MIVHPLTDQDCLQDTIPQAPTSMHTSETSIDDTEEKTAIHQTGEVDIGLTPTRVMKCQVRDPDCQSTFSPLHDPKDGDQDEVVNELLIAAGSVLGKHGGNRIFAPHKYVNYGAKNEKVRMEEASWTVKSLCCARCQRTRCCPKTGKQM